MRKAIAVLFSTVAAILLILCIAFSALQIVLNNSTFIANEFVRLGNAKSMGMSIVDLVNSTIRLINYMEGNVDSIDIEVTVDGQKTQMFALEQEHTHMEDVRTLYQWFISARDMALIVALVLFVFSAAAGYGYSGRAVATGFCAGSFVIALFAGFLGTWAAMDFSSFWTAFHQALFWNEEWLFDSSTSRMINMLPEQFFSDVVAQMAVYFGIAFGVLLLAAILILIGSRIKRKKAEAEAEKKAAEAGMQPKKKKKKKKPADAKTAETAGADAPKPKKKPEA